MHVELKLCNGTFISYITCCYLYIKGLKFYIDLKHNTYLQYRQLISIKVYC